MPDPTNPTQPVQPIATPLIITRTPYPKWWKDARAWPIDIAAAGTQVLITQTPGYRAYISNIILSVDGETHITLNMGIFGPTGAIDLGGSDQPRGMVIAMGNSPLPCGQGGFTVTSTGATVHVGGFITYYYEKE